MLILDIGNLQFSTPSLTAITVLNLVFAVLAFVVVDFIIFALTKKWGIRFGLLFTEVCCLFGWMFNIYLMTLISGLLWVSFVLLSFFLDIGEIRALFKNGKYKFFSSVLKKSKSHNVRGEILFDRDEIYQKVVAAVVNMSRNRIGALITFEKNDDLTDQMKTGSMLNAPVSTELLQTIFYPGTRLHDGAVIIRADKVACASVYFRPTTRPLTGKFGSRHRAAYGISESTDSVTIIVSEETGRISIAFQGELTPVTPDNILRILKEDMEAKVEEAE